MSPATATDRMWSQAFASQAISDFDTRTLLARANAAKYHRLHFLQMAAEKLCKAFLIRANGYAALKLTHTVIEKNLPVVLHGLLGNEGSSRNLMRARLRAVKLLGREIELLSPSCDARGVRIDNSEYPWAAGINQVQIPHEYGFPNIDDESLEFVTLIKLLRNAAKTYAA